VSVFYCPLERFNIKQEFNSRNDELEITNNMKIISQDQVPDLKLLSKHIVDKDINKYKLTPYWLSITGNFTHFELEEKIIIFQLALWILSPTKTVIPFMTDFEETHISLHQRFKFNPNYINYIFDLKEIIYIKKYYSKLFNISYNYQKVNLAMLFTFDSCLLQNWDAIYVLMVTAFESILYHKAHINKILQNKFKWGITKRLSWAFAILSENNDSKRQIAFREFKYIYNIRSDLVHGKMIKDKYNNGDINLEESAKCRDMLRKLWQVILDSEEIIEKLSGNDSVRRDYFKEVANGWMPEEENGKKK